MCWWRLYFEICFLILQSYFLFWIEYESLIGNCLCSYPMISRSTTSPTRGQRSTLPIQTRRRRRSPNIGPGKAISTERNSTREKRLSELPLLLNISTNLFTIITADLIVCVFSSTVLQCWPRTYRWRFDMSRLYRRLGFDGSVLAIISWRPNF